MDSETVYHKIFQEAILRGLAARILNIIFWRNES